MPQRTQTAESPPLTKPPESLPAKGDYRSGPLFRRLWHGYLKQNAGMMALAFVLMMIEGSTLGLLSYSLTPLFDRVFVAGDGDAVIWVGLFIFGLFLLRAVLSLITKTLLTKIAQITSTAMQVDLLRHLLTLDAAFYQTHPPGALIERVQGDTAAVQGVWQAVIMGLGRDIVSLLSLLAVALWIDPLWTLAALIGAPLLILPTLAVQRYVRRKTGSMRAQSALRATRLDEIFHGILPVKLNRLESYQAGRFEAIVDTIVNANVKMAMGRATIPSLVDLVTGIGFFAVLMLGGSQIISGERTLGEFMAFFTAMVLTFQPLRRLGELAGIWQTAAASLERVYRMFDTEPTIRAPATPRRAESGDTTITFDDVHLAYGDVPVLRGLGFTAAQGQTTALVGPSGAGKSTVFNLLARLIDPQSGRITLGGVDLAEMDPGCLRDHFSVVTQDAALFDETIRENILLGRRDVAPDRLEAVLQAAHVAEFVDKLPLGLDTPAGPRGSALSGGQRQRVAIARALLRDAPVLLMDEATSALDAQSEALVQAALDRLSAGRTTLVIAHRLATVRGADRIVVMDRGVAVDQGSHDELLARGGLYADLCRLQFDRPGTGPEAAATLADGVEPGAEGESA